MFANNNTAQLLISGGDERLALNHHGINKYGCRATPDDEIFAFSSSTASPISSSNFTVADNLRVRLAQANFSNEIYTQEIARQKSTWRELMDLETNTRLIFSPSGTDLHRLISNHVTDNTLIVMVDSNETGSGVAVALNQGRGVEVVSVALRSLDGLSRSMPNIDEDVITLVERGVFEKRKVLLILVDQSKTGMIAPSPNCAMQLKKQYPTQLDVVVDACQFRISNVTLKAYLQQEFMVALTGSKFLAAPSFSAILVLPHSAEFPMSAEEINFGLLLRMEIALTTYRTFCALSDKQISSIIHEFSCAVQNYLKASSCFEPLVTPALERVGLVNHSNWDNLPTIFPFLLLRNNKPLSCAETFSIYQQLPLGNPRCQLGQPVVCSDEKSALRLCLSAPLIVQAAQSNLHKHECIEKALLVLATIEKHIFDCT